MKNGTSDISQRNAALVGGSSIFLMAILAGFAYGYVLTRLIVVGDAKSTTDNIIGSEMLFRSGIVSFLLILVLDVVVALTLYIFFKGVNKSISLLAAWFRVVYATILGVALSHFTIILSLIDHADNQNGYDASQLHAQVLLSINAFHGVWSMGLVVFGCHLLLLAYLVYTSGYIPRIFGVLLMIAAMCYLGNNIANLLLPNYHAYKSVVESILSLPMIIGELGFGLWLIFNGSKVQN